MGKEINAGGWSAELLKAGEALERGGVVPGKAIGVRISGIELVSKPDDLAEFLSAVHVEISGQAIPCRDPQILLVGNVVKGFAAFGWFPADDPDERAFARIRSLEEGGEDFTQMDLNPLTDLVPIDPDPDPEPEPAPRTVVADVEIDGVGTLKKGAAVFATVRHGDVSGSYYALVGRDLVEAYQLNDDGEPDWENATVCDPARGDETFYFPAVALLKYLNSATNQATYWSKRDHDELIHSLRSLAVKRWSYDGERDCYLVDVQDGYGEPFTISTPYEATAFVAGLVAARTVAAK